MIKPNWLAPKKVRAFTTTIDHGSMSHRFSAGGQPQLNIDRLISQYNIPKPITHLNQVHSNTCVQLPSIIQNHDADACISVKPHTPCMILTADCLPILITNQQGNLAAGIHAGWRGLLSGVIESSITMISAPAEELIVWLGPAIGPSAFEINTSIYQRFVDVNPSFKAAFTITPSQNIFASLYTIADVILKSLGVIHISSQYYCTYNDSNLFYSHRRQKENAGRMASIIWFE